MTFIQIHFLKNYAGVLLNRDDVGFHKRLPYGGCVRLRCSSQSQKRAWRVFDGSGSLQELEIPMSIRSRVIPRVKIAEVILSEKKFDKELIHQATSDVMKALIPPSKKKSEDSDDGSSSKRGSSKQKSAKTVEKKSAKTVEDLAEDVVEEDISLDMSQVIVLGEPEVNYLRELVRSLCKKAGTLDGLAEAKKIILDEKEMKNNLKALAYSSGLDAAMFGRMVTGDILSRKDAAIHVAHSITVHAADTESDYFTAVDELTREANETGSGHLNVSELGSGLFYGYVVIDVPLLLSNLSGGVLPEGGADQKDKYSEETVVLAQGIVERLVRILACAPTGAKKGSTAPYSYASAVIVESGKAQPRSLEGAFLLPVPTKPDLLKQTYEHLGKHILDLDEMYGKSYERRFAAIGPKKLLTSEEVLSLEEIAKWAGDQVGW